MDQQQMRAGAVLVVLDLRGGELEQGHYCSRFFAGGKSREYTGLARNCFGSYFQKQLDVLLHLLAAGGEGAGAHREKADADRPILRVRE